MMKHHLKNKNYEEVYGEERAKEIKAKMRLKKLGKKQSEGHIRQRAESSKHPHKFKENYVGSFKGKKHSEKSKKQISLSLKGKPAWNKGKKYSEKTRVLISQRVREQWQNPEKRQKLVDTHKRLWNSSEYRKKVFPNLLQTRPHLPNKFEQECGKMLNELHPDFKFKYAGNGKLIVLDKYVPDFVDPKNKVIVLANGLYWHLTRKQKQLNHSDLRKMEIEAVEKAPYEQAGYKVIFVWEDEFYDNPEQLSVDIRDTLTAFSRT